MGIYNDRVLPRLLNNACASKTLEPLRARVCEDLTGDVVEVGFGSGLNVPFYPAGVTGVAAVEPSDVSWRLSAARLSGTRVSVQRSGLDGQQLPFADGSFDGALSTWTSARYRTSALHCASCGAFSSLAEPCTFSSTGWPPMSRCADGNDASTRCKPGSPAGATSPARFSTC